MQARLLQPVVAWVVLQPVVVVLEAAVVTNTQAVRSSC